MSKLNKFLTALKGIVSDFNTDGESLVIPEMKIGGKAEAKDAEGNLIEAADGEYKVGEDVIEIKGGVIVSINGKTEPEQSEEVMEEEVALDEEVTEEEPAANEVDELKESVASMKNEIEALKELVSSMQANMSEAFKSEKENEEKFSKQLQDLNDTIKMLANLPAEFSKTNQAVEVKDAKEKKMNEWTSTLAKAFI